MYYLREIERKDIPKINEWRNDEELISLLGAPYRYINSDVDYKWYENYMANRHNTVRCVIVNKKNDNIIGLISLLNIDNTNRNCTIGIMIGEKENRSKGGGTFAMDKMIEHAFCNLNMERVELTVLSDNQKAINLYEKVGFKCEGIKRNCVYKEGTYKNMKIMSILKEEYEKR